MELFVGRWPLSSGVDGTVEDLQIRTRAARGDDGTVRPTGAPYSHRPQITPRQFLADRVQQRRQHDQADDIRCHVDRREPPQQADNQPAITSKDGAGTRSRPANAATTVPGTTRNKMVSTPRTLLTSPARSARWVPTRLPGAPLPAYPPRLPAPCRLPCAVASPRAEQDARQSGRSAA
jgi:hypothetical protein